MVNSSNYTYSCVSKVQINNNSALVKLKAWIQADNKPPAEPMSAQFIDAYMRRQEKQINRCRYLISNTRQETFHENPLKGRMHSFRGLLLLTKFNFNPSMDR